METMKKTMNYIRLHVHFSICRSVEAVSYTHLSNKDEGKLQSHTIELFAYDGIDVNKSNVDFAILTHHKIYFNLLLGLRY